MFASATLGADDDAVPVGCMPARAAPPVVCVGTRHGDGVGMMFNVWAISPCYLAIRVEAIQLAPDRNE